MTQNDTPPQVFAVIKQMDNPRSFQFLSTIPGAVIQGKQTYSVENVEWSQEMLNIPHAEYNGSERLDSSIHTLLCPPSPNYPNTGIQKHKYWHLPLYFIRHSQRIPVIEFQYSSFLPSGYRATVPICYDEDHIIAEIMPTINQARRELIHHEEQLERRAPVTAPRQQRMNQAPQTPQQPQRRRQTPPPAPRRNRRQQQQQQDSRLNLLLEVARSFDRAELRLGENSDEIRMRLDRLDDHRPPPLNLQGLIDEEEILSASSTRANYNVEDDILTNSLYDTPPPIRRTAAQVSLATRPFPLPKHIGDLIIANARSGTDACPISASNYSECQSLAVTSCFHTFDSESLATWQTTHDTCPVCRMYITNTIIG